MSTTNAYNLLINGSIIQAGNEAWMSTVGIWFWPIIFIWTLVMVYIKSENPTYIFVYSILGNVLLGRYIFPLSHPIFYSVAVFSLFLTLWKIFGSKKIE